MRRGEEKKKTREVILFHAFFGQGMSFFIKCQYNFFASGDFAKAKLMQSRMESFYAAGAGGREISQYYGVSMGKPRLPSLPTANLNQTIKTLENMGFFDHSSCL